MVGERTAVPLVYSRNKLVVVVARSPLDSHFEHALLTTILPKPRTQGGREVNGTTFKTSYKVQ